MNDNADRFARGQLDLDENEQSGMICAKNDDGSIEWRKATGDMKAITAESMLCIKNFLP